MGVVVQKAIDPLIPWKEYCQKKWINPLDIEAFAEKIRFEGSTIVTINGSFDLVHSGHMHILFEASKKAEILIVALNTDASIQRYKSAKRPILPLKERLTLLSALFFVDYLTWFDETDPRDILRKIKPNVHVNGSEYGVNCIEAATVKEFGELALVDFVPGYSTSEIIKRIQRLCD